MRDELSKRRGKKIIHSIIYLSLPLPRGKREGHNDGEVGGGGRGVVVIMAGREGEYRGGGTRGTEGREEEEKEMRKRRE